GLRHRLDPLRDHRGHRPHQLPHLPPHRERRNQARHPGSTTMTALIAPAAESTPRGGRPAVPRQRRRQKMYDRPGFLTYALLFAFFVGSVFPLWWTFVIGSRQSSDINLVPPAVIPGPNFVDNVVRVFQTVDFAKA